MLQYEQVSKELAMCNRNRSFFLFMFAVFSFIIWMIADFPTSLYAFISGLIFIAVAAAYFREYFKLNFGIENDEQFMNELKKTYTTSRVLSDVRSVNMDEINRIAIEEHSWLMKYMNYIKFGFVWSVFYLIEVLLRVQQFRSLDDWMFAIFFNSILTFVLGKSVLDFFNIRINNDILRLSTIYVVGYMPIFILVGFFGETTFFEAPVKHFTELGVRVVLVIATFVTYLITDKRLPV